MRYRYDGLPGGGYGVGDKRTFTGGFRPPDSEDVPVRNVVGKTNKEDWEVPESSRATSGTYR